MKNINKVLVALVFSILLMGCSRVAPNHQGVLMENFGQNGKSDYKLVKGRVNVMAPGTELFQVPLYDQRGGFSETLDLKASNNTQFKATPKYSYKAIPERCIDIAFAGSRLNGNSEQMLDAIEDNILEPRIDDLIKEFSRAYHTDSLMATGGQLRFEKELEIAVAKEFQDVGFALRTFQSQLEFTDKVTNKIDNRNEVNANVSVLESQIVEQRKRNELEALKTEQQLIKSKGLTPEILQEKFIEKWDGKTSLYGDSPIFYKKTN
jgi:hypothetical protein